MRGLTLVTPPAAEPVSLAEAKAQMRVDTSDDDTLISSLIVAARQAAEEHTRRALVNQTWRLSLDRFPARPLNWWDGVRQGANVPGTAAAIELPRPPLQSVTSLTTYDDADTASVMAAAGYFVDSDGEPGRVVLRAGNTWPTVERVAGGVEVLFVAGYGASAADVPQAIRQGILLLAAHLYENREAVVIGDPAAEVPLGIAALWRPWRILGL